MAHACRHFAPALVLSLLDPKLSWEEAEVQASVQRGLEVVKADGSPLSPYDLKRLQASYPLTMMQKEPYAVAPPSGRPFSCARSILACIQAHGTVSTLCCPISKWRSPCRRTPITW